MSSATDRIERKILLKAPRANIWCALSNAEEFGNWFGVALQGKSFKAGERVRGHVTYPDYEHVILDVLIERIEPETLYHGSGIRPAVDPAVEYSHEPTSLVVFELQETQNGTLPSISESDFDEVPAERRAEAIRLNSGGWDGQMDNIAKDFNAS